MKPGSGKSLLRPPFSFEWPQSSPSTEQRIIADIKTVLESNLTFVERIKRKRPRRNRKHKSNDLGEAEAATTLEIKNTAHTPEPETYQAVSVPHLATKLSLCLGWNSVVRSLQTNSLTLALFDRAILKPPPRDYFTALAARCSLCKDDVGDEESADKCEDTVVAAVDGLSDALGPLLGLRCVMAIGIKNPIHSDHPLFNVYNDAKQSLQQLKLSDNLLLSNIQLKPSANVEQLEVTASTLQVTCKNAQDGKRKRAENNITGDGDNSVAKQRKVAFEPSILVTTVAKKSKKKKKKK